MTEKYKNKYRVPSARASWWNYGNNAAYFITICTHNRIHFFGEIKNQTMHLSQLGKSAEICWYDIPDHFPFVQLGAFVVMPNHVHGIIIIDKPVETQNFASLRPQTDPNHNTTTPKNQFGPQSQNLASIVRGYKIGVTKQSKTICPDFKWQSRFHDHIIRNDSEYQRINDYIENNPMNWAKDKFF